MATIDDTFGTIGGGDSSSLSLDAASANPLTLPEGLNPATADFAHEGPDMVMTWPDGSQVTVTDYFMVDPQPDLMSDQGAKVDADLASRLSGPSAPGMVAEAGAGVAEQPIGQIEKLAGTVTAVRADGTKVELKVGDQVFQGDILETAADSAIGVILADETTFSMADEGRMVLDEMVYDPGTQEGSVSLSVMQGVFTVVSGQVAKTDPDAMTLHTPVATIGIRGTQVGLDISDGQNLKIVLMEEADGFVGEVVVMNGGGVSVLNGANEFTSVSNFGLAPTDTIVIENNSMINSFASSLRYLPLNNDNSNDFGLQGDAMQEGMDAEGLTDFETAAGGDDELDAGGLADFDVAAGGEDTSQDTPDIDIPVSEPVTQQVDKFAQLSTTGSQENQITGGKKDTGGGDEGPNLNPEVTVVAANAVGQEDGSFNLNITVTATDTTVSSVSISGVPDGATLSAGTLSGGVWTFDNVDDLSGLTMTPPKDYSGTFDLTVSAKGADNTTTTDTSAVQVDPVFDTPTLDLSTATGVQTAVSATVDQGGSVALNIQAAETDVDGSEVLAMTISGVPSGASLSAGTKNADGTWTVDPATDLAGLKMDLPADHTAAIKLDVSVTSTDTLGNIVSTSGAVTGVITLDVTPTPVPSATITAADAVGLEDGTFALDISVTATNTTVDTVTIAGIPGDATLSSGLKNGETGDWTVNVADLGNLTVTPAADWAGNFDITVTESSGLATAVTSAVTVNPVYDTPVLDLSTAAGVQAAVSATVAEDSTVALNITAAETDADGSEVLAMTISGVPADASLTAGTRNADGTWTVDPTTDLAGLNMNLAPNFNGQVTLNVAVTSEDTLGNVVSTSAAVEGVITINVTPVADAPNLVVSGTTTGTEDTTFGVDISATPTGGVAVDSVTVAGIPTDATLSAGTQNTDGSWSVNPADLTGLTVTTAADYSGTFDMTVTATSADGSTSTATSAVTVNPTADAPTLSASAGAASEDNPVDLSIVTAETDVDGSEVLSMTIAGVPADASLTAGTRNADGTWTLDPATDLTGLQLNPATNFNGTINLTVTSTSTDTLGNVSDSASTVSNVSINVQPVGDTPGVTIVGGGSGLEDGTVPVGVSVTPV
ncbi:FecR domain-containing protein, partial [Pseudomonadota bacterium]